jgi:hypothetical protein
MLSREVMGVFALAILWVNVLLIAGAALKQRAALVQLRRALTQLRRVTVVRGDGPGGAFAASVVKQIGRLTSAKAPTIGFHDQDYSSALYGGLVHRDDGSQEDVASGRADVWVEDGRFHDAAAGPAGAAPFESALAEAKKARGTLRTLHAAVVSGKEVVLATAFQGTDEERLFVATIDPIAWLRSKTRLASFFIASEVVIAALCTVACLHPPVFGTVSTLGGAASLAFFLLVQPIGTKVRDSLRTPNRQIRRGTWSRSATAARSETARVVS